MTNAPVSWNDAARLEECFMEAADGNLDSLHALAEALGQAVPAHFREWQTPIRETWGAGAELVIESLPDAGLTPAAVALVKALGQAGYDTAHFRDALATTVREQFADYLDPAGLIGALGVLNPAVSTEQVIQRWEVFAILKEGTACHHPAHGAGTITEVDALGGEVFVAFVRRQPLSIEQAITALTLVRPDSILDTLRTKETAWDADANSFDFIREAGAGLVPTTADIGIIEALLVPDTISPKEFKAFLHHAAPAKKTDAATVQRAVSDARTCEELLIILTDCRQLTFVDEDTENITQLLRDAAGKRAQTECWVELVALVWSLADGAPWLVNVLRDNAASVNCWQDADHFVAVTDALAGKRMPSWLGATLAAVGTPTFCALVTGLPLRLWNQVERRLQSVEAGEQALLDATLSRIKAGDASADALLWIWRTHGRRQTILRDYSMLFRTLSKTVRGAFHKASRDLRKLLLRGEDFQSFLLGDGNPDIACGFIRAIEHSPVLDAGEKQSTLVRVVRLYPDLKSLVEKRGGPLQRKAIPPMTSRRSYHRRRAELEEIVTVKIPANSRAIAEARSHGDLRENAEFKAAKDDQAYLSARRNELEKELDSVQMAVFSDITTFDQVAPGCTVDLELTDGSTKAYHVLGMWDSDPDRAMIAFTTPLGETLLGAAVGDEIEMPAGGTATVRAIAPIANDLREWLDAEGDGEGIT